MRIYTLETSLAQPGYYAAEDREVLLERLRAVGFTYIDTGDLAAAESIVHVDGFFGLFAADHRAALALLKEAKRDGAKILSIGGEALPRDVGAVCAEVRKRFTGVLCIRPQGTLAVAAAIEAISQGFTLVAGPASLLAGVAAWQEQIGCTLFDAEQLPELDRVVRLLAELAPPAALPCGCDVDDSELRDRMARLQAEGYELETAGGTRELITLEALRPSLRPFHVLGYEVTTRRRGSADSNIATVTIDFHDNVLAFTAAGVGPLNALDRALRGCLANLYPALTAVILTDYRVKVLDRRQGTAARVRVAIDWSNGERTWTTAGVSHNVIEASWIALADSVRLELLRLAETDPSIAELVSDESWAV